MTPGEEGLCCPNTAGTAPLLPNDALGPDWKGFDAENEDVLEDAVLTGWDPNTNVELDDVLPNDAFVDDVELEIPLLEGIPKEGKLVAGRVEELEPNLNTGGGTTPSAADDAAVAVELIALSLVCLPLSVVVIVGGALDVVAEGV